jgi:uncharacterized protein (DUF58 family)
MACWALRRQGPDVLPVELHARRLYILPTRAGWAFGLVLLGMLFGGLNYANSLALLLTFLLATLGVVAMLRCHRRLLGLVCEDIAIERVHAGQPIPVRVRLRPPAGSDARDLRVSLGAGTAEAPGDDGRALLRTDGAPRGPWRLPRLRIATQAPFGLFEAWTWLHPPVTGLVWPAAVGRRPLPESGGAQAGSGALLPGVDEWTGLRPFRDADSPRQVAWKAYARGAPLLVREYHDARGRERRLRWEALAELAPEARLSQLAAWVQEAARTGEAWALELPDETLALAAGTSHRERSLDALARHGFGAAPADAP